MLRRVDEVLEELPVEHVPSPIQPRRPQFGRQRLQLVHVVGLSLHQRLVVLHKRLDEAVVLRALARLVLAIHKQPLDVAVSRPARVAGKVAALRKVVHAAHAGRDLFNPLLL